jgi:superoxide dismutase
MAFNNHFFFRGINADANIQSTPSTDLENQIRDDFSSLETLRETFLETAEAMFGPGFVWLVQTNDTQVGSLRILPTYIAGSPLSAAHYRRQSHDLNTHNADTYQALNSVGTFGSAAKQSTQPKRPLGGVDVVPLLCVNTWEHVWLWREGKEEVSRGVVGQDRLELGQAERHHYAQTRPGQVFVFINLTLLYVACRLMCIRRQGLVALASPGVGCPYMATFVAPLTKHV